MPQPKRKPSAVVAEAIRELSHELDGQRVLLEDIKALLVQMNSDLGDHRRKSNQDVADLGERVQRLEQRLPR